MAEHALGASLAGAGAADAVGVEVFPAASPEVLPPASPEVVPVAEPVQPAGQRFTRNALLSVGRLLLSTALALVLPAYLTHKLPVATYGAWVLILQMSAYVGYLDFGIQAGISKFVAEYEARGDWAGASERASAGLALMAGTSVLGVLLTAVVAWQVPALFHAMPAALTGDVRVSLLCVGISLSFGLLCSVCSAVFTGLQRYGLPMVLALVNRVLYTAVVCAAVYRHSSLAVMGALVAAVHVLTGLLQVVAWRRLAGHVRLRLRGLDWAVARKMLVYCATLAVWTIGMLLVSGLDVTLVGKYDFEQTAFYSVATMPTNFMLSVIGAAAAPLLPTLSAYNVHRDAHAMGDLLLRVTRYCTVLLLLCGLPLLVGGYWVLRAWVGASYATQAVPYLRVLVLANIVRMVCLPYSSVLVATDSQKTAIAGATAEAVTNLGCSLYLVRHIGAIGVAYGTLIGSFVSVASHFAISMRYTYGKCSTRPSRLLAEGMLRPAVIALPSLVLLGLWWRDGAPALAVQHWTLWAVATLLLAWFGSLNAGERTGILRSAERRLSFSAT